MKYPFRNHKMHDLHIETFSLDNQVFENSNLDILNPKDSFSDFDMEIIPVSEEEISGFNSSELKELNKDDFRFTENLSSDNSDLNPNQKKKDAMESFSYNHELNKVFEEFDKEVSTIFSQNKFSNIKNNDLENVNVSEINQNIEASDTSLNEAYVSEISPTSSLNQESLPQEITEEILLSNSEETPIKNGNISQFSEDDFTILKDESEDILEYDDNNFSVPFSEEINNNDLEDTASSDLDASLSDNISNIEIEIESLDETPSDLDDTNNFEDIDFSNNITNNHIISEINLDNDNTELEEQLSMSEHAPADHQLVFMPEDNICSEESVESPISELSLESDPQTIILSEDHDSVLASLDTEDIDFNDSLNSDSFDNDNTDLKDELSMSEHAPADHQFVSMPEDNICSEESVESPISELSLESDPQTIILSEDHDSVLASLDTEDIDFNDSLNSDSFDNDNTDLKDELSMSEHAPADHQLVFMPEDNICSEESVESPISELSLESDPQTESMFISDSLLNSLNNSIPVENISNKISLTNEELRSLMTEIDGLLELLPDEKIEELSKKNFYHLYIKFLDELGI